MRTEIVTCDNCGIDKKETNHWYAAWVDNRPVEGPLSTLTIETFRENRRNQFIDLCGQQCVSACVYRWMATGKLLEDNREATTIRT